MDEIRRLPSEWEDEKNLYILDPDGWRSAGRSWFERITEAEFDRFASTSTVGPQT